MDECNAKYIIYYLSYMYTLSIFQYVGFKSLRFFFLFWEYANIFNIYNYVLYLTVWFFFLFFIFIFSTGTVAAN